MLIRHTRNWMLLTAAKQELMDAETDDEVDRAVTKVRTLCDL